MSFLIKFPPDGLWGSQGHSQVSSGSEKSWYNFHPEVSRNLRWRLKAAVGRRGRMLQCSFPNPTLIVSAAFQLIVPATLLSVFLQT
jgi:hypothetical protein